MYRTLVVFSRFLDAFSGVLAVACSKAAIKAHCAEVKAVTIRTLTNTARLEAAMLASRKATANLKAQTSAWSAENDAIRNDHPGI